MHVNPYSEDAILKEILSNVPDFDRYIDLNFGNGDILFHKKFSKPCFVNDVNSHLVQFYENIQNPDLLAELDKFACAWRLLKEFSNYSSNEIFITFKDLLIDIITLEDAEYIIRAIILMNIDDERFSKLFNRKFLINLDLFTSAVINSIVNEFKVIKGAFVSLDIEKIVLNEEFKKSIELAFKFGFFSHFQNILNLQNTNFINVLSKNQQKALWYFLSQNCKGKYNYTEKESSKNKFSGELYAHDRFSNLIAFYSSNEFTDKCRKINFYSKDISEFLNQLNPSQSDFIVGDFRSTGYFYENPRDVYLKNEVVKTIEFLKNSAAKWILLFSSQKFFEVIESYVSINTQTIEYQGKTTIVAKSF